MRSSLRTTLLAGVLLLSVGSVWGAQISLGITIGPPPRPRIEKVHPVSPGRDYVWIDGYWFADGRHYKWHAGYWTRPPYAGAHWVAPRHDGKQFFAGYWDGDRGRMEHDHKFDRDRDRDFRR